MINILLNGILIIKKYNFGLRDKKFVSGKESDKKILLEVN